MRSEFVFTVQTRMPPVTFHPPFYQARHKESERIKNSKSDKGGVQACCKLVMSHDTNCQNEALNLASDREAEWSQIPYVVTLTPAWCALSVQAVCQASCSQALPYRLNKQASLCSENPRVVHIGERRRAEYHANIAVAWVNRQQHKQTFPSTQIIREQWKKSKYHLSLLPAPLSSLPFHKCWKERVPCPHWNSGEIKRQPLRVSVQARTHGGDIQPCFQHLLSKAPGVVSLKKTWGWNPTLLLALRRLKQSSCHCECHYCCVSNGRPG